MALPMLVSGADCGPLNPLQGLSKGFDQDRGLQQDHFGPGRAGSSRQIFRSQKAAPSGLDQDVAKFFSDTRSPLLRDTGATSFDFSGFQGALPSVHPHERVHPLVQAPSAWAADFVQQRGQHTPLPQVLSSKPEARQEHGQTSQPPLSGMPQGMVQWGPPFVDYGTQPLPMYNPGVQMAAQPLQNKSDALFWDQEFTSQETLLHSVIAANEVFSAARASEQQTTTPTAVDVDDLARTAGLLVEAVKNDQNPKFQNSAFLGLMRKVRDREMVIDGNTFVEQDSSKATASSISAWADEFKTDVKGKGKAVQRPRVAFVESDTDMAEETRAMRQAFRNLEDRQELPTTAEHETVEDPNDVYFRQDNEDYIQYWNSGRTQIQPPSFVREGQSAEWDKLQNDWDRFEATASGIRPVANYQFQLNNPYLLGDSSRTRQHTMHLDGPRSFYESVLEMEAAVQREPINARAWFDLGVKQQENERETKAIEALRRALELDPSHLPAWLALAISHTNENNRQGAFEAIREWVSRNERYDTAVREHHGGAGGNSMSQSEGFRDLSECLMAMARSVPNGEVDADIQIALAVLLNTNEDYAKAQDCFRTALAVRPDDWLLYNRVGATLANSGNAEEALQYYHRALELNPAYIRARFNLGISCINLRRYEEAAQHILDALVFQASDAVEGPSDSSGGVTSSALWDSLKTTCLHLQRIDLATICDRRDLEGLRREFHA